MVEERITSVAQFEPVSIDLTGIHEWPDMINAVTGALQSLRSSVQSEHVVARLRFIGITPLAWRIRRDRDLLGADAANRAFLVGKTWVEKIEIDCRPPAAGSQAAPSADPILELRRLIADQVVPSDAYKKEVAAIADELRAQLPPECRSLLGIDEDAFNETMARIVDEGAEDILARLQANTTQAE